MDKKDSDIFIVSAPFQNTPPGTEVFAINSIGSNANETARITAKTDGNSVTYSNVYTDEVIPPVIFGGIGGPGGPSESDTVMMEYFLPPKVKMSGVQLREVYSKGDSTVPDHHWLTAEFLDPSDQIIATAGVSLGSPSQSYKFAELGIITLDSTLESKVTLSTSEAKIVKDAFFDVFEDIVLENTVEHLHLEIS